MTKETVIFMLTAGVLGLAGLISLADGQVPDAAPIEVGRYQATDTLVIDTATGEVVMIRHATGWSRPGAAR